MGDEDKDNSVETQVVLEPCGTVVAVFNGGARPRRFSFAGPEVYAAGAAGAIALELAKEVWVDGPFRQILPSVITVQEDEDQVCHWTFELPRYFWHGGRFLAAIAFGMAQHLLSIRRTQEPPQS